jgi:hypothetical protein
MRIERTSLVEMEVEDDDTAFFIASSSADTKPSYLTTHQLPYDKMIRAYDDPKSPVHGNQA